MKKILLFIVFSLPLLVCAQDYEYKKFEFDNSTFEVTKDLALESEITLLLSTQIEYIPETTDSKEILSHYSKKYINSEEAIERNNKIYIPFYNGVKILDIQLRITHKNGKITFLDEKSIKTEQNTQTGMEYNYFPVEGLEIGSIIDFRYVLIGSAEITGKIFLMQNENYIKKRTIELIYPNFLKFVSRSYNGAPELVENKDKYKDKISLYAESTNISGLDDDERYANWYKNVKYIHTRFYSNNYSATADPYGEKEFTARIHANLHRDLDKNEQKSLLAFSKTIKKTTDAFTQIRAIESSVKNNIQFNKYITNNTLTDIIKSKQGTLSNLALLYINLFKTYEIPYEIVFTSNPYQYPFDPEFVSYVSLTNLLFYFPTTKTYLDPSNMYTRTPAIEIAYHNQYALFIQNKIYAGVQMGVSDFKKIDLPYFYSKDIADIHIDLSHLETPLVSSHIEFTGDMAYTSQAYLYFSSPQERETLEKEFYENYNTKTEFISATIKNIDIESIGINPLIVDTKYNATNLLKKAGTNFIFEIGAVIGKQMEFYSDKTRKLPIQVNSARSYKRTLTVKIPQGYQIKNLKDLDMTFYLDQENKELAYFTITYKLKDNTLTIENLEGYNFVELPITYWNQYRKVINAAADFNKLSLILEKSN
ncbi:MAG: DUF3857 domain-containing protein [Flavobacteriaceae bacterium]|jgi:hypothetical protein|nr:DUF3857 domain-containing protein [Flavobacteriaceae bacterium]